MFDLQYIILGITQGLTEFLPISSSAHLILISNFFTSWKDQGLTNDIAVHFGTLGAVIFYLRKEISNIIYNFISFNKNKNQAFKIIIATLPALIIGFLIYKYFYTFLRQLTVIAYANIFFAILLYIVDKLSISAKDWKELNYLEIFLIGIFQCLAFIPGASRAGVTITGARYFGLNRESSAIFSMLLSIPIILASFSLAFIDVYNLNLISIDYSKIALSSFVSFVTALLSINFMIKILKKTNFTIFIVYRIVLGIILLMYIY